MQVPTRLVFEGRPKRMESYERINFHQTCRGNGDGMQAKGTMRNTGSPSGDRVWINWQLARDRLGRLGWRKGSYDRRSRVTPVEGRSLS
jgi:hypothetical protein